MIAKMKVSLILLSIWLLTGCVAAVVGAGVGVGTYTYIKGELKRSYQAKFEKTLQVCIDILNDLNQPIIDNIIPIIIEKDIDCAAYIMACFSFFAPKALEIRAEAPVEIPAPIAIIIKNTGNDKDSDAKA